MWKKKWDPLTDVLIPELLDDLQRSFFVMCAQSFLLLTLQLYIYTVDANNAREIWHENQVCIPMCHGMIVDHVMIFGIHIKNKMISYRKHNKKL
jgi:hypothetical protein